MKTFQEFQEAALALPLAAPIGKAALPIVAGGIKLASDLMKADTARPRTPNVQRPSGKITAAEKQKRQAQQDRRAAAAERNRERAEQGIDALLGTDAERREAAAARANQSQIQRRLRQQALRKRMEQAAERNNIPEAYSKAEKESHVKPKPVTIQTITRTAKDDGKVFPYREVLPKKNVYHNTPVVPTVLPKKKDKPVWKNKEFQYPGMPIKDLLGGGTTL